MEPCVAMRVLPVVLGVLTAGAACVPVPVATLDAPSCVNAGTMVLLDARASTGSAGSRVSRFVLEAGDGAPALVREQGFILHRYAVPGTFTARVTVTDALERSARTERVIRVPADGEACEDLPPGEQPLIEVDACQLDGVLGCAVDLGEVRIGTSAEATVRIRNVGGGPLLLGEMALVDASTGTPFTVLPTDVVRLEPGDAALPLRVRMEPAVAGSFGAVLRIRSNATNAPLEGGAVDVTLRGVTPETPFARLEVEPLACDFGAIPYDSTARCTVTLRSTGTLPVDLFRVALSAGTPDVFAVVGTWPALLQPAEEASLEVTFTPPRVADFTGQLEVDSSDPALPRQTVFLRGTGVETPPVARVRILSVNGGMPLPADRIRPLDDVVLTAEDSTVGRMGRTLASYRWELVSRPDNSTVELRTNSLRETRFFFNSSFVDRFGLDVVGTYTVRLVVTDSAGVESAPVDFTLQTRSDRDLLVQLTWSEGSSDVDLHVVLGDGEPFTPLDCYYSNCPNGGVQWFEEDASNPRLDVDDVDGFGPENTSISRLADGTYRVALHLFDRNEASGPIPSRVQIFVRGESVLDETRGMDRCNEYWRVADIRVLGGVATVTRDGSVTEVDRGACR